MSIKRIFLNFSLDFQRQFVRVQLNQWLFWICYAARGAPLRLCIAELNQWSFLMCYAGCALNSAHVLQSVQLFCSVVLNSSGIDYHVIQGFCVCKRKLQHPALDINVDKITWRLRIFFKGMFSREKSSTWSHDGIYKTHMKPWWDI